MSKSFKDLRFEKIEDLTSENLTVLINEANQQHVIISQALTEITELVLPLMLPTDETPLDVIRRLVNEKLNKSD